MVGDQRDRRPVIILVAATATSLVGSMLTIVALPWFVLETTGSAARAGLSGMAFALPSLVSGIFGGTLVDRFGFKRSSVLADAVSGVAIALIPILHLTVGLAFWQLLALAFLSALLEIPGTAARRSMLPELAERAGYGIERVNAAFEGTQNVALFVGPPIGGFLIGFLGASEVLLIDGATFAVAALAIMVGVPSTADQAAGPPERYWQALKQGLRFVARDGVLVTLVVGMVLINVLTLAMASVVLPVYANEEVGSARALGFMIGAIGVGATIGAFAFGALGPRLPRRALFAVTFIVVPFAYWVLVADLPVVVVVAVLAVAGAATGISGPLTVTIRQERTPPELRGRVFGATTAIGLAVAPLGIAGAGLVIEAWGLREMALAFAVAGQAAGLVFLALPSLKRMSPTSGADEHASASS